MKSSVIAATIFALVLTAGMVTVTAPEAQAFGLIKKKNRKGPIPASFHKKSYLFVCTSYGDCGNWNIK